jgi:cyclopropane fatty-acyl-phospholipid synthase-like methyltransferase
MTALRQATYSSAIFNVGNMDQAKRIILTPEEATTEQRWERETPYLLSLIEQSIPLNENSFVLDYGCGIGRMSKALIDRFGCSVVGVDISKSMRSLAREYVGSDRFVVYAPEDLETNHRFDAAIAIWVLQHCFDPANDIARIKSALRPYGQMFVVNDHHRIVPCREAAWVNDGKDIADMLDVVSNKLDPSIVGKRVADASYWAVKQWV